MAIPFQKFREIVFQLIYGQDIGKSDESNLIGLLAAELAVPKSVIKQAQEKALAVLSHLNELDDLIGKASTSYSFERIHSVERNILRLGAYEFLHDPTIPPKVAIAEAIRLTRKFASPEAATFINAVMDNIYKASLGQEISADHVAEALAQLSKLEEEVQAKGTLVSTNDENEKGDEITSISKE